ncbi:uncharacterized protein ACA1_053970 [Acanthamoeba castellanii str. Neff]|uniref:Uncharacterized protein n=1 Tax=Acanthamoeba castellanii (strain ATCC 30010 / Neff) TaxID=1257118 RepID=L8H7G6_ACACF|nr:uncharacterized protein ACA1_053970 [Acanthamoeba castellanii str. Neff]ELR20653.1 hypothetical protein ACA1_053970 [Acanthamoeba castellanii str. Neff]
MAQHVKLEEEGVVYHHHQQQPKQPPQYTGRRNSALAVARRASMADVLANNARRSGSLGDVLLNASNSAASSLQLYLHSLIQRNPSSSSSSSSDSHELTDHSDEHVASSTSTKKSSKRKRKEAKEAKRARKSKASSSSPDGDPASSSSSSSSSKKKRRGSSASIGSESMCEGLLLDGSPAAPPSVLSPSSYPSASSSPSTTAQPHLPPSHLHNANPNPHLQHGHHNLPHQQPPVSGVFTSFDECFDADLAILSTLSADEVELSPTPLSSSSPLPPTPIGAQTASVPAAAQPYRPAALLDHPQQQQQQLVYPQHQQQQHQHVMMGPPVQPALQAQVQMHVQQAASFSHGYPQQHHNQPYHHHQQQPYHHHQLYQQHPPPYGHHQQQAYPSPQPSPSLPEDWSGLSPLFPSQQEASASSSPWQPRSPALSMHEQVERLLCPSFPASPFSAQPPASPASTHHQQPQQQHAFLRPPDVVPRTSHPSVPSPSASTATDDGMLMIPAASPMSSFFDWADELLAFDPSKGPTTPTM